MKRKLMKNLAFIVGCARSGTSILGEYLASNRYVRYVFEAHDVWEKHDRSTDTSHRRVARDVDPVQAGYIRGFFEQQMSLDASKRIVIEKCPRNALRIPFVHTLFPSAKFIHIVRDGRDVACSLRPGLSESWRHLKPPRWQEFSTHPLLTRCAETWREVVEIAIEDLRSIDHIQIKYEDLLSDPAAVGQTLCVYLDLPYTEEMAEFEKKIQNSTQDSYHSRIQMKWFRDDHRNRSGRWKENLTPDEQRHIVELMRPMLDRLGYLES